MRKLLSLWIVLAAIVAVTTSSFGGSMSLMGAGKPSGGGAAATQWNPSDSGTSFIITNSGRTATATAPPFGVPGGRSISSQSTGKFYWEIRIDTFTAGSIEIGMCKSAWDENSTILNTANGSVVRNDGLFGYNGTNITGSAYVATDVVSVALDLTNSKIWFRTNSGIWNGSGTDNPATNTGGLSISGFATPAFACAWLNGANNQAITARFSSSDWTVGAPSGFGQL
jgi:hypothetical protein